MACEVEQPYGPVNFIENATKLHLRALESWKRGIHTLNERLISMQIERDTLREQLEAMHAGYKKQLQLKVMKINELQNTISDITKKLNANTSEHVKEEDVDSNDMENGTSLHEEGYDDPYTSDDQSPELSHADYNDVYLDACTDEDTPTLVKQRQSNCPEDSRGIEGSCSMDQHGILRGKIQDQHTGKELRDNDENTSGQSLDVKAGEQDREQEEDSTTTSIARLSPPFQSEHQPDKLSEEPVVVTVLPDDHGRSEYMQTEGTHESMSDVHQDLQTSSETHEESVEKSEEADDEASLHNRDMIDKMRRPNSQSDEREIFYKGPRKMSEGFGRGPMLISKPYSRGLMNPSYGHTVKRSVSESEISSDQSFKLPKLQPAASILGRSCLSLKGPARRHMIPRPNSYAYSQVSKNTSHFDSTFVPTMSNVPFQNHSTVESGMVNYSGGPHYGDPSQPTGVKSESKPCPVNAGSISQLASFYQKEFDISKQYKCDFCGSKYTKLASLRRHLRAHTGIKPYKCMSCFKEFTRRDVLKIHMERHKVQNQYGCYICGLKFAYVKDLREHGLNQHKEYMSVFKESLPGGEKD